MTAQEMILKGIIDEAHLKEEEILKKANEEAETLLEDAKKEAKAFSGEVIADALKKAVAIKANANSAAELILRDARLRRKNREIGDAISLAVKTVNDLPDDKYFEILLMMIGKMALTSEGEVLLSSDDLKKRNTELFSNGIKQKGFKLTLTDKPADIKSGFVLRFGDIEINSSFEAIANEKREQLEDTVKDILFKQ